MITLNKLTFNNFFTTYSLDPSSLTLSGKDRNTAWIVTIALGIFTLGLLHLGTWIRKKIVVSTPLPNPEVVQKIESLVKETIIPPVVHSLAHSPKIYTFDELTNGLKNKETENKEKEEKEIADPITSEMRKRNIPLIASPNLPKNDSNYEPKPDAIEDYLEGWKNFVEEHEKEGIEPPDLLEGNFIISPPSSRKIAALNKTKEKIQYISMNLFDTTLKNLTAQLDHCFVAKGITSYTTGFNCGKSTQWVTSLALKHLNILPSSWFSLKGDQGTIGIKKPDLSFNEENIREDAVVLFDDCAYSGNQIESNVETLSRMSNSKEKTVFIVIPYVSKRALSKLNRYQESFKHFQVLTSEMHIDLVHESFNKEEVQVLHNSLEFYQGPSGGFNSVTSSLCYTAWRYPDGTSFVQNFGQLSYPIKVEEEGQLPFWELRTIKWLPALGDIPRPYAWNPV